MAAVGALLAASPVLAQDKNVKIGVLNDMSSLYADIGGPNSIVAAKLAVEDSGLVAKGWKIDVLGADHQNKPDVGVNIARQWADVEKVDMITDTPNSGVMLAVSNVVKEKNLVHINSGGGSSVMTGKACTPNSISVSYDTYMLANGTGKALTKTGGDSWFFLTADYAFGAALEADTTAAVKAAGGKIAGGVKHPLNTADFSSFLLQAQSSNAKVVGLANAGGDTTTAIKQASEFGLTQSGIKLAQGLTFTESFYWDLNDDTRAFAKRFSAKADKGQMPSMTQAGVYSGVLQYLKTLEAMGGNPHDGAKVVATMKASPWNDKLFGGNTPLRADGRRMIPAYLFQVKKPEESKGEWDLYKKIADISAEDAARPLSESECPLIKK
jgi:branched-chain amino acid transport system substrate-binding protein